MSEVRSPKLLTLLWLGWCSAAWGADLPALVQERTAIERVYYQHRLGQKPPFEEALPHETLERLVRRDLRKEAVLQKVYGVAITPEMLAAEVQRIHTSTRAPAMLAEIKAALGNDPEKFANAFAKPFLVERLLRDKFENDDALHADRRRLGEEARRDLLAAKARGSSPAELLGQLRQSHSNAVTETTWELTPRPAESHAPAADELEIKKRFGPNARILSSPPKGDPERKLYFQDLRPDLQRVLRVQLCQAGDVSAVIETPGGFRLYVCKEKTADALSVARLSFRKRSYEQWLEEQAKPEP